jgi:hypothetical protein
MSKHSRNGGKFTGSHTTCIPASAVVADIAEQSAYVTKIALGYIKAGLKPLRGERRVKMTDDGKSLLLQVRDNTSHQELRIFTTDQLKAKKALVEGIHKTGMKISSRNINSI